MFEADTVADVIIEDYYDVMAEGYNGVIGKAENGSYYEYLTEDPVETGNQSWRFRSSSAKTKGSKSNRTKSMKGVEEAGMSLDLSTNE
jgi:hypothetical protein